MKFRFFLPEKELQEVNLEFLPSIMFAVLSRDGIDMENHFLQGVYARRIPHILKIKTELVKKFKTQFVIPIGKDRPVPYYVDVAPDSYFNEPDFLTGFERLDYLVRGNISLDKGTINFQIYSREDKQFIYERKYQGNKEEFYDFVNDFTEELLRFFEITIEPQEKELIKIQPVSNRESFISFMEALDVAVENNVGSSNEVLYVYYLKKALEADPKNSYVGSLLADKGGELIKKNQPGEAEALENFILTHQPDNKSAHLIKMLALLHQKKTEDALRHIDQVKNDKLAEELKEVPYLIAYNLMQSEEIDLAENFFEKASEIGLNNPDFFDSYTFYLAFRENYKKALEIAYRGLDTSPHRELTLMHTAQLLTLTGNYDKADTMYKHALNFYPRSPRLLASRAIYYLFTKEFDKVKNFINEALELTPEDQEVNLEGAKVYHDLNDDEEAQRLARTAIDLNPVNYIAEDARYFLSRISAGITEEEQKENRARYIQALRLLERGELDKSRDILKQVTEREPLFWDAWFMLALAYRKKNKLLEAIDALEHVDELFPDQVALHHEYARCYMGLGDFVNAFPHMFFAFRKNPEDPIIMANMGIIYLYLGKLQEAEVLLYHAKKMAPNLPIIDQYIKQLEMIIKRKKAGSGNGGSFSQ